MLAFTETFLSTRIDLDVVELALTELQMVSIIASCVWPAFHRKVGSIYYKY